MKKGLSIFLIFGRSICYLLFLMSALILSSCSGDGDRNPDSDELTVTGIEDDTTTRKSKTWNWGCRENNESADCEYRYAINKKSSHTFSSSDDYDDDDDATTEEGLDGKYYIHVQAKSDDTDEESSVARAFVTLDNTLPDDPDPSDFKAPSPSDEIPTKVTVESLEAGDRVHIYVVGGPDEEDDTENSSFLGNVWGAITSNVNLTSAATTTTIVTSSNVCADDDNEVGLGTVARGKTEVTVDVNTKKGEHEYYATITDEAGNKSACIKVFTYENTSAPEPPTPTACPSIKPLPHWKFVEGLCRPSCGSIAGHAGYGGLGPDGDVGTADDPHVLTTSVEACSDLTARGHSDWEEFSIEDGGRTISSNDAHEVAERGGVCCSRGSAVDATAAPEVLGLEPDSTPRLSKTFTWSCNRSSNCRYRYTINEYSSHVFPEDEAYTNTTTITKTGATRRTKYYLHVQAAAGSRESEVKSVSFILSAPTPPRVTGLANDSVPKASKTWNWGCDKGSCTYRYAINKSQTHQFSNNENYTSTRTATKRITSASDNGTYYLHIQVKDANNNESEIFKFLAVLEVAGTGGDVEVTGLSHDTNGGRSKEWDWGCNKSSCTYRHVINTAQNHDFTNEDLYNSTQTATKTITAASENNTYYLHVQAKDSNNNESDVETVLVVLNISVVIQTVYVTGLSHDDTPKKSKTWTWGCNRSPCTYRHAINQSQTYTFSRGGYNSTKRATKTITSASDNGIYYLHVQAKDSNDVESEVETVIAVLEVAITSSDVQVTDIAHDTSAGNSKTWRWGCNKSSCTYRHAINQNQKHTFSSSYGSTQTDTKTISSASDNGTYYLHVQAKDSNNNESDVKTVLAVLEVTAVDVNVTGLSHDDVPKVSKIWTWNCSNSPCTYRYAINQNQSHTLSGSYRSTRTDTKTISSSSDNGVYYLHVQARDSNNNESEVETVIAILQISTSTNSVRVTGLSHDTNPKPAKTWNWGCDQSSCTYRYIVNQSQTHTFTSRYRSNQRTTRRITSSSQNGTYYLHVQARDSQGNESDVETVLAILQVNNNVVGNLKVTGIADDIEAKSSKTWTWDCTNNSGACSYRHVINQSDTHSFPASHSYESMQRDTKTVSENNDNGTYYLYVQTKDAAGSESAVESVVAYLSKTPVSSFNLACTPVSNGVGKNTECILSGGNEYRYVVNDSATHIFEANDPYSPTTTSVAINVADVNYNAGTTYYVHAQGKDTDGNLSDIKTNFITLTAKTIEVKFDEDETKKLNKMSAKWTWECNADDTTDVGTRATKPCVYRYAVNTNSKHEFDNNDGYGITDTTKTKTLAHKDEDGTYFVHVQTKDANNNVSTVSTTGVDITNQTSGVELKFELDLVLKSPEAHTDESDATSLQLHLDETPTFTLRGVLDDHKVTLYSSSECTDGSNDDNGNPTEDTRISSELTMSSGQVDITISNNKFSDLTTYPIYVGVKESSTSDTDCYAIDSDTNTPKKVSDIGAPASIAPLFAYTLYNPIAAGADTTCYLSPKGDATCWGNNTIYASTITPKANVKAISINGTNSACYITNSGSDTCVNDETTKAVASGVSHYCGILGNYSVKCTGTDTEGQVGGAENDSIVNLGCDKGMKDGNNNCPNDGDELKAKAVATGDKHSCVILLDDDKKNSSSKNDGKVLCWGFNAKGQLGQNDILNHGAAEPGTPDDDTDDPTPVSKLAPIELGNGRTAKSITAGQNYTCALLDNNTVKCWGHNILGQLGQNNVIDYGTDDNQMNSLSAISLGRTAKSIVTGLGSNHTCAVLSNDTVKCWGNNWKGQLGQSDKSSVDGTDGIGTDSDSFLDGSNITINRNHGSGTGSDVPLKTGEPRSNIQTKSVSSLSAIKFGCNSGTDRQGDPLPCTSSNNFKLKTSYSIAVGKDHVCAVLVTDQAEDEGKDFVKCWGSNDKKQLGHDENKNYGSNTDNSVDKAPRLEVYSPPPTTQ